MDVPALLADLDRDRYAVRENVLVACRRPDCRSSSATTSIRTSSVTSTADTLARVWTDHPEVRGRAARPTRFGRGSEQGPVDVDDGGGDGRPVVGARAGALLDLDPAGAVDGQPVDDVVRVVASEDIVRPGHPDADP